MNAPTPERTTISVEQFMANVEEARENGYDLVCVECGVGVYDDSDIHERGCSHYPEGGYNLA